MEKRVEEKKKSRRWSRNYHKPKAAKQTEKEHNNNNKKQNGEKHEEFNLNKQTATAKGVAHAAPLYPPLGAPLPPRSQFNMLSLILAMKRN